MSGASQSQPGNRAALSACCNACDVTCCPSGACASTVGSSSKSITSTNPRSAMSHRPSPLNPGSALRILWSSWCDPKAPNYWPRLRLLSLFEMYWAQGPHPAPHPPLVPTGRGHAHSRFDCQPSSGRVTHMTPFGCQHSSGEGQTHYRFWSSTFIRVTVQTVKDFSSH